MKEFDEFVHNMEVNDMSPRTIRSYKNQFDRFMIETGVTSFKDYLELKPAFFENYNSKMKEGGLSSGTRRLRLVVCKRFYAWLIKHDYLENNPVKEIVKVKPVKKQEFLDEDEMNVFMSACRTAKQRALFMTLFETGMRFSELVNIKIQDIAQQYNPKTKKNVYVVDIVGKGDKHRLIGLSGSCMQAIQEYLKNEHPDPRMDNYLFVSQDDTKIKDSVLNRTIRAIAKRAGLEDKADYLHVHTTRHSFASKQMENGCSLIRLSGMLGHSNISTTEHYIHSNQKENARYMAEQEAFKIYTRDNEQDTSPIDNLPSITEIIAQRKTSMSNA